MGAVDVAATDLEVRLRSVPAPRRVMTRERARSLTTRQREILDQLEELFEDGFAGRTMAEIAARVNCSLRTLYELAPSRDDLVLTVVDRILWRIGRSARGAITPEMAPIDAVRAYLLAANAAVGLVTETFARDLAAVPSAQAVGDAHNGYLVAVTRCLLDLAVERGDLADVDTAAVAHVVASLGRDLSQPEVSSTLRTSPRVAADAVVDVILNGLSARRAS